MVVQGDGHPSCVVVPWSRAREHLCREFFGLELAALRDNIPDNVTAEEAERWRLFSDFRNWSVGEDGQPFGVEDLRLYDMGVRAYFLTGSRS